MIHPERVRPLNDQPARPGRWVLYWMQASQRSRWNHALEWAIERANQRGLPLVVAFGLTDSYPEANERHYAFMLEGLADVQRGLAERGVRLVVRRGAPDDVALELAEDAAQVIVDGAYLRHQRAWRRHVAEAARRLVEEVEADAVVPVETAAPKEAYSAATLRPRLQSQLKRFLTPLRARRVQHDSLGLRLSGLNVIDLDRLLATLAIDRSVGRSPAFRGGERAGRERLDDFVVGKLRGYAELRNDPSLDHVSHLSPYLHFGQISPLEAALAASVRRGRDVAAFLEELIVRRELSLNFCRYNPHYDRCAGLPAWARQTLARHARDARPALYSATQLERAETHDPYWNAAQLELVKTGKMHNYMRMYWGKKILEWTRRPTDAFALALRLNNRWELDGRDPNSYAGVAWVFGKHDRPWGERPIFGMVRCLTDSGLKRKFDIDAYVARVGAL